MNVNMFNLLINFLLLGACDGTLSCSTCHLIFSLEDYKKLPNKPTTEELDMLDLAFGLTETLVEYGLKFNYCNNY